MHLWQAILVGCDARKQAVGELYLVTDDGLLSCVLGAAFEALGSVSLMDGDTVVGVDTDSVLAVLRKEYPALVGVEKECPECSSPHGDVFETCIDLNDGHKWSREKIALEFVKPIEDQIDEEYEKKKWSDG